MGDTSRRVWGAFGANAMFWNGPFSGGAFHYIPGHMQRSLFSSEVGAGSWEFDINRVVPTSHEIRPASLTVNVYIAY